MTTRPAGVDCAGEEDGRAMDGLEEEEGRTGATLKLDETDGADERAGEGEGEGEVAEEEKEGEPDGRGADSGEGEDGCEMG